VRRHFCCRVYQFDVVFFLISGEDRTFLAVDGEGGYQSQLEVLSPVPRKVVLKLGAQVKV
jgi:hypothetical protein